MTFQLPPPGMLSEQRDFPEYALSLGLIHKDGAGLRVVTWDGEALRHMSPAAARRFANDLGLSGHIATLAPVIAALRALADRVGEIEAAAAARHEAGDLADMDVEGSA